MELKFTSKVLYQVAKPIPQNEDITELYRDMFTLMIANNGIGLAAPQIGISKRLIVFRLGSIPYTIINPIITKRKLGKTISIEGCLSFPSTLGKRGKLVKVFRDKQIVVEGFNQYWKPIRLKLRGLDSCVIQHEIDHLDGITIIKPIQVGNKMSRYELTINVDYIPHWTIQDGLRELIQNALDESVINSSNSMNITREGDTLLISTKNAKLDKSSLLIGSSSKRKDSKTIGKEGEGYKLACLVLVRAGHKVQINNYHEKEKWIPKIIKSRRYKSKLMVIDTEKFVFLSPSNSDLTFKVDRITDEIYNELLKRVLFLNNNINSTLKCKEIGEVLLDEKEAGRIYVNGLYVSTIKDGLKFGYNFNPDKIELDRDRRAVTDFNLTWETSNLWLQIGSRHNKLLNILVKSGCKDVSYINSHHNQNKNKICNNTYNDFKAEFGNKAYPVSNQSEHDYVNKTYQDIKPVIVNETRQTLIKSSSKFSSAVLSFEIKEKDKTPTEILQEFKSQFDYKFDLNMIEEFNNIIRISNSW